MPDPPDFERASDFLAPRDAVPLIDLAGLVGFARQDPYSWRMELLTGILRIFQAAAAAAFVISGIDQVPAVVSLIDAGFKSTEQRKAFSREFATAPFLDPFSRKLLERFHVQRMDTLTCLRADLVNDAAWAADTHVLTYRRNTGMGDCMLSLFRATERGTAFALLVFRAAATEAPPGAPSPGARPAAPSRFAPRDRLLMDTLHRGLEGIYRGEESARRVTPAGALPPRLRQTLEYLLTGDTERQVALKMSLSVHTVHDYVKALYAHFGVSSRGELMSKWIGPGGQAAPKEIQSRENPPTGPAQD